MALALLIGADETDALLAEGLTIDGGTATVMPSAIASDDASSTTNMPVPQTLAMSIYPSGTLDGLFSRGVLGGFAAGFLGSGVLGVLFGRSLFGDLGGVPSYLGLLFQLTLLVMLLRLIWTRWFGRHAPSFAAPSTRQLADPYLRSRHDLHPGSGHSGGGGDNAD